MVLTSPTWEDIKTITQYELAKLRELFLKLHDNRRMNDNQELMHPIVVLENVIDLFSNKKLQQLEQFQQRIKYLNLFIYLNII